MNHVILMGNLTRDPETKIYNSNGVDLPVTHYTLAVKGTKKDEVDFFYCTAFGQESVYAEANFRKGMKVSISGRLKPVQYEKDGVTIYKMDIIVNYQESAKDLFKI